jgi:hypothetical protein
MAVWDTHADYDRQAPKWKRARDARSGQDAVSAAGQTYLPMLKDQDSNDYDAYKKRATWYGATAMVISGLAGMIFRKAPKQNLPAKIQSFVSNIDMRGTPLDMFAKAFTDEILTVGRVGILVDHPPLLDLDGRVLTQADAEKMNLRPTLNLYKTERILNWKHRQIANKWELSMVVLSEHHSIPKDEFSDVVEERWRVLDLDPNDEYRVRVFRKRNERDTGPSLPEQVQIGEDLYPLMNGTRMNFIPFYCASEDDVDICPKEPPLIDLVDLNLAHWRVTADYEHGCHFTGLPTPVISGYTPEQDEDGKKPEKLFIGSNHAWVFPDPQAKATYLEFNGQGLKALENNLDRKEAQMAVIGSRMIMSEKQGKTPEGATTTVVHRTGESSRLASIANSASTAFSRALEILSQWAQAPGEILYQLNRDFMPIIVDSNALNALVAAVVAKTLPFDDFWEMLQRGDIVPADKEAAEALADIKTQPEFIGVPPTKKSDKPAPAAGAQGAGK